MTPPHPIPVAVPTRGFRGGRPAETRARLLQWARDVIDRGWCRQMDGDRVELTCSQADLARRLGYSPTSGGVSKRLAALESLGVVVSRDPVVFDRTTLTTLTGDRPARVHEVPSRPAPTGYHLEVARDASPGSDEAAPSSDTPPDRLACAVRLLRHVCTTGRTDLVDDVLACLPHLVGDAVVSRADVRAARASPVPVLLPYTLTSSQTSSQTSSPTPPPTASVPLIHPIAETPAARPPAASEPFSRYPSTSALPVLRATGTVPSPMPAPGRAGVPSPSSVERLRLLTPLLEDCRRLGLPGIGSPAGLLAALDGCSTKEVQLGVELIRRQLAGNVPLRSPVGLLAHLARSGELALLAQVPLLPVDSGPATGLSGQAHVRIPSDEDEATWLSRIASLMRENPEPPATR